MDQSLAMASNWMDEIRSDSTYDYAEDWHFVTIPQGKTYAADKKKSKWRFDPNHRAAYHCIKIKKVKRKG